MTKVGVLPHLTTCPDAPRPRLASTSRRTSHTPRHLSRDTRFEPVKVSGPLYSPSRRLSLMGLEYRAERGRSTQALAIAYFVHSWDAFVRSPSQEARLPGGSAPSPPARDLRPWTPTLGRFLDARHTRWRVGALSTPPNRAYGCVRRTRWLLGAPVRGAMRDGALVARRRPQGVVHGGGLPPIPPSTPGRTAHTPPRRCIMSTIFILNINPVYIRLTRPLPRVASRWHGTTRESGSRGVSPWWGSGGEAPRPSGGMGEPHEQPTKAAGA